MSRTVLIPQDSPLLRHASTRVLNRYPNGAVLVVTDAPVNEAGVSSEVRNSSGLNLAAPTEVVDNARLRFPPNGAMFAFVESEESVSAYVEFIGQIDNRWLDQLRNLGITILSYHPESSYLCYGPLSAFHAAQRSVTTTSGESAIKSVTELTSELKRKVPILAEAGEDVVIVLVGTLDQRADIVTQLRTIPGIEILDGAGNDMLDANRIRIRARIHSENYSNLLRLPRVLSVEPYVTPIGEDEVAGLILAGLYDSSQRPSGSYLNWLQEHGLDGHGVTVGIVDNGVDISHPAFSGRARDLTGGQKDWHATMVAGHAVGNYLTEKDANQFIYGIGTAPAAEVLSQDKMQATTYLCRQTVTEASPGGMTGVIQNNSWGKETRNPMDYGSDEAMYDALVRNADASGPKPAPLTICFSSGNSGSLGLTRPKAAKNVIVTGNSESFRPNIGHDGSDNIGEVYSGSHGSSHGNCGDGRIRPHVVAPGEWTASANYDCYAGEDEFISPMLTWGGGSSGASPKTAGACALLTQWWRGNNGQSPSPAMLRALIVNGAEPILTGGAIPNNRQGWGRLNIQNILEPSLSRILVDQTTFLSQPTERSEWRIRAVDHNRPVKITLAWTDPPGAIGSGGAPDNSPIVNKLALRAEIGSQLFRGVQDRFRNGFSVSDDTIGTEETLDEGSDNLQNIFLEPSSVTASILVSVTALNVTTNCTNGMFDTPRQDFALVITNGQIDAAASPASIVVAVDGDATGSAPANGSDGHWSAAPGNDDNHLLNGDSTTAPSTPPPTGTPSAPSSSTSSGTSSGTLTSPVSSQGDDVWWDDDEPSASSASSGSSSGTSTAPPSSHDDDVWWNNDDSSDSETQRHSSGSLPVKEAEAARRLEEGFNLLGATGHRAETVKALKAGESPAKHSVLDLSAAIANLKNALDRATADPATPPFCAVLVVGAGTRVTVADIRGLRALAFAGTLFLVSDSAEVIAFLAQRIGNQRGIRYRLAKEPSELGDLILDTMAEAGGLQSIVIPDPVMASTRLGLAWTYQFGVVSDDRTIVIHIRSLVENGLKQVRLKRPNAPDLLWRPMAYVWGASENVAVSLRDGLLQISDSGSSRQVGTWTVEVTDAASDQPPSLKAWALGGPWISVSEGVAMPAAESGSGDEQRLVRISGEPGVNFIQAFFSPPRVGGTLVAAVRPSRIDNQGKRLVEDKRPLPVPVLGQVVKVSSPLTGPLAGASVLDLPISVIGTDAQKNHFARRIRTNLVRLRLLSQWQGLLALNAS